MSNIMVSIIVPCYNMGHFLPDTLSSIERVFNPAIHEVIIINDGSTDAHTIDVLRSVEAAGNFKVINQANKGLAGARNAGLAAARGKYILPLDADNLLTATYLDKGVDFLEAHEDISVVYGLSKLFGEENEGYLSSHEWSLQTILQYNYIDACALCRRAVVVAMGGYDEQMKIMGFEDWELWIRLSLAGYRFHFMADDITQEYRVVKNSMLRKIDKLKNQQIIDYIQRKYAGKIDYAQMDAYYFSKFRQSPLGFTLKLFLRQYWPARYNKLVAKGSLRKYL